LLGLEFRLGSDPPALVWKAVAVGDSCLFVLRRDKFDVVFPLSSAVEFGNHPPLVPSSPDRDCPEPEWLAGWAEPGDLFLLATDAVARFLLDSAGSLGENPLIVTARAAVASGKPAPMVEFLGGVRKQLNDDASVIAIRVADSA